MNEKYRLINFNYYHSLFPKAYNFILFLLLSNEEKDLDKINNLLGDNGKVLVLIDNPPELESFNEKFKNRIIFSETLNKNHLNRQDVKYVFAPNLKESKALFIKNRGKIVVNFLGSKDPMFACDISIRINGEDSFQMNSYLVGTYWDNLGESTLYKTILPDGRSIVLVK